jgi:pSer/pThr/pTyr-binding forkhead associated (FHA) protein
MVPAIENNKSKKLLNKYSRNEEAMEVEAFPEKVEEKAAPSSPTANQPARPINELLIQQSDGVSSFYCLKEEGAKIGRHSSNKILILEESVSRYHAEI